MGCDRCVSWKQLRMNIKAWSFGTVRSWIISICEEHGWNLTDAAKQAKMDRANFLRLMRQHGVRRADFHIPPTPDPRDEEDYECST